jgi:hypothetical protein
MVAVGAAAEADGGVADAAGRSDVVPHAAAATTPAIVTYLAIIRALLPNLWTTCCVQKD